MSLDRSRPPEPGAEHAFRFPAFEHHRLENGLTLYVAAHARVPLVSATLLEPAGGQHNPLARPGLCALTAAMLDEGTARRSAPELAAAAERLGGALATGADWNVAWASASALATHLGTCLELVAEVVRTPTFPEAEVERLRRQTLAELLRRHDQPAALAEDALAAALYTGTPYGSPLLGTREALESFTRADSQATWARLSGPRDAALVVAGDLDPARVRSEIERLFGDWTPQAPQAPPQIIPAEPLGVTVHLVDRPGATQTELRLGHVSVPRNHPDRAPLQVMNSLLGGKFTSRINLNLRERHGYTYGAASRFVDRLGPGPFVVAAAVSTEATGAAAREVIGELERLRNEAVGADELADTKSYLTGVFPFTVQTHEDLAARLQELAVFGLPDSFFADYLSRLRAVTAEDVLRVAQAHLRPTGLAVVAVGPAARLRPQLDGLGPVFELGVSRQTLT